MRSFPYSSAAVAPGSQSRRELQKMRRKRLCKWEYSLHKTGEPPILPINAVFRGTAWDAVKLIALWAESIGQGTWLVVLQAMRGVLEPRLLKSSEHVCTRRLPCRLFREADLARIHTHSHLPPMRTPPPDTTSFVEGRWYTGRSGGILYIKDILRVAGLVMTIRVHLLCALKEENKVQFVLHRDVKLTVERGLGAPISKRRPLLPLMFHRSKFKGPIEGLVYKTGLYGTGYYLDAEETVDTLEFCETFSTDSHTFSANDGREYTGRYLRTP